MSQELDKRIAEVKGWRDLRPAKLMGHADWTGIPPGELRTYVPRWSSDLNLMHGLVAELDTQQYIRYLGHMDVLNMNTLIADYGLLRALTEATAEQKASAWLLTTEGG